MQLNHGVRLAEQLLIEVVGHGLAVGADGEPGNVVEGFFPS